MNVDDIAQFLDRLPIGRTSRYSYACTLRAFLAFVLEHTPDGEAVSLETVPPGSSERMRWRTPPCPDANRLPSGAKAM